MRRRKFITLLGGAAASWPLAARAQQPAMPVIGFLNSASADGYAIPARAFRQGLKDTGYVEGQNVAIEYRWAEGQYDHLPTLAADLVRRQVGVIVANSAAMLPAKAATTTVPIVFITSLDPVQLGLVASLSRPGGNVTGVTNLGRELGGKRLELLKEAVPKIASVAVLYDAASPGIVLDVKEVLPVAARALGLIIQPWEIRAADDFGKVFAALSKERPDGLYVAGGSPLMVTNQKRIVGFALKSQLPSVYIRREFVDAGGLMSYHADLADSYRRVAYFVDKILKGAKPPDLPVEQPTKFEFIINLKTANQIGVTFPPDVLARANKLIK